MVKNLDEVKQQPRAFLVLGPESSGTRMVTGMLIEAGCVGNTGHDQWLDHDDHMALGLDPIVLRRSVPHAGQMPNIHDLMKELRGVGYLVQAVVTVRHFYPCEQSQVSHGHVTDLAMARDHLKSAYPHIFTALIECQVPYYVVTYCSLVYEHPDAMLAMLKELGLNTANLDYHVFQGNSRWLK